MSTLGLNPIPAQGNLNRVITHIVVTDFPGLSVTAPYMSKEMAIFSWEEDFTDQIGTATGIVNSPAPYVMGQIVVNLLRSQSLSNLWIAQAQVNSYLGSITAYSDSTAFTPLALTNASILRMDPGPFDGTNPTVKATIKGTFYLNSVLWG
jgi:hypothetical protein